MAFMPPLQGAPGPALKQQSSRHQGSGPHGRRQYRGPCNARYLLEIGFQALDHDLPLILDGVDHQHGMARRFGLDHDQHGMSRICLRAFNPQLAADMLDRKELAANVQNDLPPEKGAPWCRERGWEIGTLRG